MGCLVFAATTLAFQRYSFLPASGDADGVSSIVSAGPNRIAFVYDRGIWVSDGSPEGTKKVVDYAYQEVIYSVYTRGYYYILYSTGTDFKYIRLESTDPPVTLVSYNKGPIESYYGVPIGTSVFGVWAVWHLPGVYQFSTYDENLNVYRNRTAIPDYPDPTPLDYAFFHGQIYTRYDVNPPGVSSDFYSRPSDLYAAGSLGHLYFAWEKPGSGTGRELWRMDSSLSGTTNYAMVADINPGSGNSNPNYFCEVPGVGLFFFANPTADFSKQSLFYSDGISGVRRLHDFELLPFTSIPIVRVGNRVVFIIQLFGNGVWLWSSDGTVEGTIQIMRINDNQLASVGDYGFFVSSSDEFGLELYQTDGTPEGTFRIPQETIPGPDNSSPYTLTPVNGDLYFNAYTPDGDIQVYKYTPERTVPNTMGNYTVYCYLRLILMITKTTVIFDNEEEWVHPDGVQYTWGPAGTCEVDQAKSPSNLPVTNSGATGSLETHSVFRVTASNDFYGCGHFYPTFLDFTGAKELRFWIKSNTAAKAEIEVNAPCNPYWNTAGQSPCKPSVYIPSTAGQWKSFGIPLSDRPATEFAQVYSPFLITVFGEGEVIVSNIAAVY